MSISTHETQTLEKAIDTEPHDEHVDFLSIADELRYVDDQVIALERDMLAAEMAKQPEKFIPVQFAQLADLYRWRSDRQTYYWSRHIEEATLFASRTLDRSRLEEVYMIFDDFDSDNRDWQAREYIAWVQHEDDDRERMLRLDSSGVFTVQERSAENGSWLPVDGEVAQQATVDFFRESLRATSEELARTDSERHRADEDVLEKLKQRFRL